MNTINYYDNKATYYAEGRPKYPEHFIADLYNDFGFSEKSVIADIGCGTGNFALELLKRNSFVYCVEPNDNMRLICEKKITNYPRGKIIAGRAERTNLSDCTVDFVTSAQSFHWFDHLLFKAECMRILRRGGKIVLVWNLRDTSSKVIREIYAVHRMYCDSFEDCKENPYTINSRINAFFKGKFEVREYDNPIIYDKKGFLSRNLSSSYSLTLNENNFHEYSNCFEKIFDKYSTHDKLCICHTTKSFIGRLE